MTRQAHAHRAAPGALTGASRPIVPEPKSATRPLRRTFLREGPGAFLRVFRPEDLTNQRSLKLPEEGVVTVLDCPDQFP